jgi:hypothetical protein
MKNEKGHGSDKRLAAGRRGPEYEAWRSAKKRCYCQTHKKFPRYGGRGIVMCDRWLTSFDNFLLDMGRRPSPEHSLDRWPDNDGHYEKDNCRWATAAQQNTNTSSNVVLEFQGKRQCVLHWARELGIKATLIYNRLEYGWSVERALTEPVREYGR